MDIELIHTHLEEIKALVSWWRQRGGHRESIECHANQIAKLIKPIDYRKLARGRPCMAQIPGVCQGGTETTVLAHLNVPGLNVKAPDIHGAWCCCMCHAWLDADWVIGNQVGKDQRDLWHLQAVIRTQRVLIEEGKL
jgi:hypothetical protein